MTATTVEPVRKSIVVNASQAHVFKVFTQDINAWWPRQHHIGKTPLKRAVLEPGVGGRWYSVCEDGSECDTGRVALWDPVEHIVLTWQITAQWQFDPTFVTHVDVRFIAEGPGITRVELEHRDLHRYGVAAESVRASIGSDSGWGLIVANLARVAEATAA